MNNLPPPRRQKNLGQCTISGLKNFSGQVHCCPVTLPQFLIPKFGKGSFCTKSIFAINLRQKCAPNFVRVTVLRQRSFENTPSNSPWVPVTAQIILF
jgi:hypothetical protein